MNKEQFLKHYKSIFFCPRVLTEQESTWLREEQEKNEPTLEERQAKIRQLSGGSALSILDYSNGNVKNCTDFLCNRHREFFNRSYCFRRAERRWRNGASWRERQLVESYDKKMAAR